jgi:hypothetical protein
MDDSRSPHTSQKADVRPISFVLDNRGSLSSPVYLPIRPEDLSRSEPIRASVHQTLGREVQGWVDNFGEGLPNVTISGHTGWGYKPGLGLDGFQSFEALNELVAHDYPAKIQQAIDYGHDPAGVKLLFIDLLDSFAWQVVPTQFNLRRSKSSPLLFRYNIVMQAVSTSVDGGLSKFFPFLGSASAGLNALDGALGRIFGMITGLQSSVFSVLRPIANTVMKYVNYAVSFLRQVQTVANAAAGLITGAAGIVIGVGKAIAQVGREIFRTFASITGIGVAAKQSFIGAASAFNEIVCIFSNSLRPGTTYEDYTGLYGASNCSSTTGGRAPSAFTNTNVFAVINPQSNAPVSLSGAAISGFSAINKADSVLSPLPQAEIDRHLTNIMAGTAVVA